MNTMTAMTEGGLIGMASWELWKVVNLLEVGIILILSPHVYIFSEAGELMSPEL